MGRRQHGFTLVELVMIIIITAILAGYAVSRFGSTGGATGSTEAAHFARDLRHAQTLAITTGAQLCVNAAGSIYSVSQTTAGSPPTCNAGAMTDPTTGAAFSVTLENTASFTAIPSPVLRFDSLGRPSTGSAPAAVNSTYTLTSGGSNWLIAVQQVTGLVTVTP